MKSRFTTVFLTSVVLIAFVAIAGIFGYRHYTQNKNNNQYGKLEYSTPNVPNTPLTYRFPGEFEKQQAIWMQWPSDTYNQGANPVNPVMVNIIKAFDPYIRVNIMSQSVDEIVQIRNLLQSSGYTGTNAHFYVVNHLSIWARDVGPIFLKDNKGGLSVVDFGFNNYSRDGSQYYISTENQIDRSVAQMLKLPVIRTTLISEGGAIESNGQGTLMVPEAVALTRNPGMTKQQIENEYKRVLGLKKVIWLKKGLSEDDPITSGHINEFARFASPNTILLTQIQPSERYASWYSNEDYQRMEENYNILKNSTDQNGNPFKIVRVPVPPTFYTEAAKAGIRPTVRSYLNYAATNGAVLMQSYWKPGRADVVRTTEAQAKSILQSAFPDRTIIGIDAENVNLWGGGIHCITQHMPAY